MIAANLRRILHGLRLTPLHPQWFAYRRLRHRVQEAGRLAYGIVLDIGCADRTLERHLAKSCRYIGMDNLVTGQKLYSTHPDVSADAHVLPFGNGIFDTVVMMEVAEHLFDPVVALLEARRVLKPGGRLILTVPFMYPVHDAPHDFQRWTAHGLMELAAKAQFSVDTVSTYGHPAESGALMFGLGISFQAINLLRRRHPLTPVLLVAAVIFIPICNTVGWLASRLSPISDNPMPIGFMMLLSVPDHA